MRKFINNLKAGAKQAPAFLIAIYFLLIILDLYTTYLASPDLKLEDNFIIKELNLNWPEIIFLAGLFTIILVICFLWALYYLNKFYIDYNYKKNKHIEWKIVLCIIILTTFYSHLLYSFFIVVNNYLSYVFLYKIENIFSKIADLYINNMILGRGYIYRCLMIFSVLIGFTISLIKIYRIKKIRM